MKKLKLKTSLKTIMFIIIALAAVLPVIYLGVMTSDLEKSEAAAAESEAWDTLDRAEYAYEKNGSFADFSVGPLRFSKGCLVIKDNHGSLLYASDKSAPKRDISSLFRSSGTLVTDNDTLFYKKLGSEITACFILPQSQPPLLGKLLLFTLCYFVLFALLFIFFHKTVYTPTVMMENVLNGAVHGDTDFDFSKLKKPDPLYSIFNDLDALLANMQQLITRESNAQLMKKQAELDALQSQINPHFLYNTLDCIRGQAIRYGLSDIEVMTRALSKLFRYSISNHSTMVTLEEELANVDSYLLIQQMRFNNKFIKKTSIDDDALPCKIPKLIIQPIIENAIHHGLETKLGQGTLTIRAYITEQRLIVNISDDGSGISQSQLEKINACLESNTPIENEEAHKQSVGLINVNSRIKLSFGNYYGLNVYSTKDIGTDVQINLPLITG